jgi:hypothetical protein
MRLRVELRSFKLGFFFLWFSLLTAHQSHHGLQRKVRDRHTSPAILTVPDLSSEEKQEQVISNAKVESIPH